ncbi:MAG: hypothetical protein WB760_11995 [Xanthobacteraceae bacterium]
MKMRGNIVIISTRQPIFARFCPKARPCPPSRLAVSRAKANAPTQVAVCHPRRGCRYRRELGLRRPSELFRFAGCKVEVIDTLAGFGCCATFNLNFIETAVNATATKNKLSPVFILRPRYVQGGSIFNELAGS